MVYAEPMAISVVQPAVRELMTRCSPHHELDDTVTLGGDGFTLCAHIRVQQTTDHQAKVSLACWAVSTDTARYLGGNPPTEDEYRLAPHGTATADEDFTQRVISPLPPAWTPSALHCRTATATSPSLSPSAFPDGGSAQLVLALISARSHGGTVSSGRRYERPVPLGR
ncbi:hypothetical protein [Streptomyces sp. NPDC006285]|uniref:hypothetical protein n=1 Tax=Streptomyces sp. NPDC006285 TaxID=3364742 RepID=UPI00367DE821